MAHLAELTAPRFSFSNSDRKKPLRGLLFVNRGRIRWPLNEYRFVSPRSLHFEVRETGTGSMLVGQFRLWLAFRVIVIGWLCVGILFQLGQIVVAGWLNRQGWPVIRFGLLGIFGGLLMGFGYTWICIALGRRRERDLVRVLKNVMSGAAEAGVVKDLLIRP
jgi:hypothetical protein